MSVVALLNFRTQSCLCQELLPIIFDKIYESKTSVVVDDEESRLNIPVIDFVDDEESRLNIPVIDFVDDEESRLNIPVIDLEKEVFDLDSHNYNQTFATSNVVLVFQALQLALPVIKI